MWRWIKQLIDMASPHLREAMCEALNDLEEKANQTPNPIDNIVVYALKKLVGCE